MTSTRRAMAGERSVITIGAYDGVHLGHQAVIAEVAPQRRASSARAASWSPSTATRPSVVRPESAPQLLTDLDQKLELLAATGVDATGGRPLRRGAGRRGAGRASSSGCSSTAWRRACVVVGDDFHFGRHRTATSPCCASSGAEYDFDGRARRRWSRRADGVDEPVSSTAIRRALAGGDVELAARDARPAVRGPRPGGPRRPARPHCSASRRPTSRCRTTMCLPADGVYAGWYERPDGERPPVRDQPRPPADVLRARRPLAARGAPARLRRRPLRRAGQRAVHPLPAQRAQVRRHRGAAPPAEARRRARPQRCWPLG